MKKLFASESVTAGHPDKLCDQISDAVLDAILTEDPVARVACETCATTGLILVMGEITTQTYVPIQDIARSVTLDLGYDSAESGFDGKTCAVITAVHEQSQDISQGVNQAQETRGRYEVQMIGAGDQGMMFGYACNETPELMPLPIFLAHQLTRRLSIVRKNGTLPWLRPDGKTQVTVEYAFGRPKRVDTVLVSTQHAPDISQEEIRAAIIKYVIKPILPPEMMDERMKIFVNPTGRFVIGGPQGDAGLTGRKIIVDTYGGMGRHGGGCFSGKDPSKVDRSGAYMARYVAKNVVAAGLADRCEIQIAYAIGVAHPVSIMVDCFGTEQIDKATIEELVRTHFDLRPAAIIRDLRLLRPIYEKTAAYGHFGREDADFTWESTDKAAALRSDAGLS